MLLFYVNKLYVSNFLLLARCVNPVHFDFRKMCLMSLMVIARIVTAAAVCLSHVE